MKAIILAAGKGTRMRPLTEDTPKPLLPIAGKPMIQHNIDLIEDKVDEIIVVAGYEKQQFDEYFSDKENITVIEQEEALGTADAALQAKKHVEDEALILNGDDIYGEEITELISKDRAVLADTADKPENYGVFKLENRKVTGIIEKPENPPSDKVNTGCFKVKSGFFNLLEEVEESERGEYEITDALEEYLNKEEVELVEADRWLPCSYPWQLLDANEELLNVERRVEVHIPNSTTIKGEVVIESGAEVRENSVIEGPVVIKEGCKIGPDAYIRKGAVLEKNVEIGKSEIKNTVIRGGSKVPHFSYIGDSYLGKGVNIGGGTKTANLRNDNSSVKMIVKGEMFNTERRKLGAIIGSEAKLGINNSIKPGRKIGYKSKTDSGEKIQDNIPSEKTLKDGEIK